MNPNSSLLNFDNLFSFKVEMSFPFKRTFPDDILSNPAIQFKRLLLPLPLGPIIAVNFPFSIDIVVQL